MITENIDIISVLMQQYIISAININNIITIIKTIYLFIIDLKPFRARFKAPMTIYIS